MTATAAKTAAPKSEKKATKAALKIAKGTTEKPVKATKAERPITPSGVPCYNWTASGKLTRMHVRILEALSKAKNPLTEAAVASKVGTEWVKTVSWAIHAGKSGDPYSLIGRKLVKESSLTIEGKEVRAFAITPAGTKALEKSAK